MDEAHKGGERLFASQGDASEALELVEEAFDLMPLLVEPPVDGRCDGAAGISLDLRGGAKLIGDEGPQRISIIGGIGDDVADATQARQQSFGLRTVAMLSRRRMDADRQADGIDGSMQLGRQPATRATDRGSFSPPLWMARP